MSKLLKDLAVYGVADLVSRAIGFITLPIVTRLLTVGQYGSLSLLNGLWTPASLMQYGGMDSAYPFFKAEDKENERSLQLITTATMVSIFFLLVIWLGIALVSICTDWINTYAVVSKRELLLFLFTLIPIGFTYWLIYILRFLRKPGPYVRINLAGRILPALIVIPVMWAAAQQQRLEVMWGIGFIVQAVALVWALHEMRNARVWPFHWNNFSFPLSLQMLRFGSVLVPSAVAYSLLTVSDRYLTAWFLDTDAVGILQLSISLGGVAGMIIQWFGLAFDPHLIGWIASKDVTAYHKKLQIVLKILTIVLLALACISAVWSDIIVRLLFTPEYAAAAPLIPVIILANSFSALSRVGITTVIIANKPGYSLTVRLSALFTNILVGVILIPRIGVMGAVISTLAAESIMLMLWIITGKFWLRNLNLDWRMTLVAGGISGLFVYFYSPLHIWTWSGGIVEAIALTALLIIGFLLLLRISFGKEELLDIMDSVSKMFRKRKV